MVYHTFQTVIFPALVSFLATVISTRFLMNYMSSAGIVMEDKNKEKLSIFHMPGLPRRSES